MGDGLDEKHWVVLYTGIGHGLSWACIDDRASACRWYDRRESQNGEGIRLEEGGRQHVEGSAAAATV